MKNKKKYKIKLQDFFGIFFIILWGIYFYKLN
jgi:hypothetical protein